MSVLERIVQAKKASLEKEISYYENLSVDTPARDFVAAIQATNPGIIAEIKYASPAKGEFGVRFTPTELAKQYEIGGAAAISVLACVPFFKGSPKYVTEAKLSTGLPILWKDFIFDIRQISLAKRMGADAALLIYGILQDETKEFIQRVKDSGLTPVVEINDYYEGEKALEAGAEVILINNRNLKTMSVDIETTISLFDLVSPHAFVISASGIKTREDITYLTQKGIKAFLIGEGLAAASDPRKKIRTLLNEEGEQ